MTKRPVHDMGGAAGLIIMLGAMASGCAPAPPPADGFREPERISSADGRLETDLYVQFAKATVSGATSDTGERISEIWTRAYGTRPANPDDPHDEVPGPTLAYHPGDWLGITLHNQLNRDANPWLEDFQDNVPTDSQDDIDEHVPSELNIPH
jgi:FtsP/CotA-like multicopper oxidase with cupredoxin domain